MNSQFIALVVFLVIALILFLILRDLVCWYYKINHRVQNQEKIIELLEEIKNK